MPSVAALLQKPLEERSEAEMRFLYQHKKRARLGGRSSWEYKRSEKWDRETEKKYEAALAIYTELDDRTGQALFKKVITYDFFGGGRTLLGAHASLHHLVRRGDVRYGVLHRYLVPEESAFCWGAVPCPFSPTALAPWVLARMAHIRSMDYPLMQQQMLDFVDMVIDLSAQQRRKKRAYHIDSSNPELWSLFQVAAECRQSVEFWLVFSTVLEFFSDPNNVLAVKLS